MKTNNPGQKNFTDSRGFFWRNLKSRYQIDAVGKSLRREKQSALFCTSILILLLNTTAYAYTPEHVTSELEVVLNNKGDVIRYYGVTTYALPKDLSFSAGKHLQGWRFYDETASDIEVSLNRSVEHINSELELVLNDKGEITRYNSVTTYALPENRSFSAGKYGQDWCFFNVTSRNTPVGLSGSDCVIGENHYSDSGSSIKTFEPPTSSRHTGGDAAIHIAIDTDGISWVVSKSGEVYKLSGSTWEKIDATPITSDIATGKDGSVWRTTQRGVDRWIRSKAQWQNHSVPGTATHIAIDDYGNPWIINTDKQIYRLKGSNWGKMPGTAIEIGTSGDRVWITGDDEAIYFWDENINAWEKAVQKKSSITGWRSVVTGKAVSVDYIGHPWIIDQNPYGADFWSTQSKPIG